MISKENFVSVVECQAWILAVARFIEPAFLLGEAIQHYFFICSSETY